jgi:hypothetical protein
MAAGRSSEPTFTAVAMHTVKSDMPDLPARMKQLPVDARGYPVPYFVAWYDASGAAAKRGEGTPDFRMVHPGTIATCHTDRLCWVCGQPLGSYKTFVIGPMNALSRTSPEPPSHLDCADVSARACPFLVHPKERRRENRVPGTWHKPEGQTISGYPRIALVWTVKRYEVLQGNNDIVFDVGTPEHVRWYTEGRLATRAEVLASIQSGLPHLYESAKPRGQAGADDIKRRYDACMALVPAD